MDPTTLSPGTLVLACSKYGIWMRARVEEPGERARVRFVSGPEPEWLPALFGLVDRESDEIPPERLAVLPAAPPKALPPIGAAVIALWDGKRFHKGTLIGADASGAGIVRFDEGDELAFAPGEILPCGAPIAREVEALRARGFTAGAAVRTTDDHGQRRDAWISELGSGRMYVRWPGVSWGLWAAPERVTPGGRGRPVEPRSVGEPGPGARARVRWVDREIYDATVLAVDGDRVGVRYDDGTEQTVERARVVIVTAAPPPVRQAREQRALEPPIAGAAVLAQKPGEASWLPATVMTVRGAQLYVKPEKGEPFWTWGNRVAGPLPERDRFPARNTPIVVVIEHERQGKRGRTIREVERRAGRAGEVLGDRLTVLFGDGEQASVALAQVWQRGGKLDARAAPHLGEHVDVERVPGKWEEASVEGPGEERALVKVRFARDHKRASVDPSRVRARPVEIEAPPLEEIAPPPPPPTPMPPPPPDDPSTALLRAIASRWGHGGYRGDPLAGLRVDETAIALPVDRGTLLVRVHGPTIAITADVGASDVLPPAEAPLVRLAGWMQRWLGGPAGQDRAERDRAWARELCGTDTADAQRAGGALTLTVLTPAVDEILRIARAVHARVVDQ